MSLSPRPNQVGSAPYAASSSLTAQVSPTRPQPRSGSAAPPRVYMTLSRSGQIRRPCMLDVVADVDHRGHLGADAPGVRAYAEQETGAADAAGQYHDPHTAILAYRPGAHRPGWRCLGRPVRPD